ncbi:MAG: excinuclease ABC subunit UvrA [Candidatus Moranbacteria bacterium CG_4_8_14_3_um_filter_34_16]|nr:MAG: excinuclease ABC subunit UvrA [Candidatus Moranbacteria bacterium CG08_land_8_20_14_0_20_34_16]PIW95053.1 MAG: excinuclease ABC subunit UvrA [Candidatus Moranbacteria bacterium CG_4_8_14_3_um_filter_34_16]
MKNEIVIRGAREHNLKNVSLNLPRNKFIVFTGISGSGKSTLAFDTIFAEGQRRYLESLSSYARQFLATMKKPQVDYIEGLSPAISIDQKASSHNPRSTVGTITEIHDYLRLFFSKIGLPHCPQCGREIKKISSDEIVDKILKFNSQNEKKNSFKKLEMEILAPMARARKGEYIKFLEEMFRRGFSIAFIDGKKYELGLKTKNLLKLDRYKKHSIDILVDKTEILEENRSRIFEGVEKALRMTEGLVKIKMLRNIKQKKETQKEEEFIFNQKNACPVHNVEFPEMEPRFFSFNSPYGACPRCEGLGIKKEIDFDLVSPDKNKTISEGGILPWSYKKNNWQGTILRAVTNHFHIPDNVRLRDLSEKQYSLLFLGNPNSQDMISLEEAEIIPVTLRSKTGASWKYNLSWRGVVGYLEDRYKKTDSNSVREDIEKYMSQNPCSLCNGSRYRKETLAVTIGEENIFTLSQKSISETLNFFQNLKLSQKEKNIAEIILKEIISRLGFLENVGLGYLSLERSANTLAGGETQRIRLASQIGSQLVGVLYILDEPSIGLHARDNLKLLETLLELRDLGNTLIVVEHDEETMLTADFLVDIGPRAGNLGGEIVASGKPEEVLKSETSLTAKYLRGELKIDIPSFRRSMKNKKWLTVRGARENNLKNIDVNFPLKSFVCVTGVSGSGKSTLVKEILYKSLAGKIMRSLDRPGRHNEIMGVQFVDKIISIDQSPIGRTPRSNPATYTGLFTEIRNLFSQTRDAKIKGYGPGRFSFNVKGGRCDNCQGDGQLKIEMQFMPDVFLECEVCKGKRYNSETLKVKYKGKNIADVLNMTVSEARLFFQNFPQIHDKLAVLEEVGLEYIHLGQSATTFSGGEAQRIKLATELSRRATGNTLYVLDEPTTGLHFDDIKKLLGVLDRLVNAGNSVVVIEHNLDVIKSADWIIDLGPEGGDKGGKLVVAGTPEEVAKYHKESWTGKFLREVLKKGRIMKK